MNTCYLIFSICIINQTLIAQNFNDPMKFFPAKTGDIWEYFYSDPPYSDTLQLIITKDSVDEEGSIHLWQTSGFINPPKPPVLLGANYYKIDTSGNVEGAWDSYRGILYKLYAQQGDQWVLKIWGENGYEMVRVDTVFNSYLFGIPTQIKSYRRYFATDSTFSTGLDRKADYLGYNFGFVQVIGLEGLGSLYIKGAVINSVLFGDTTQIITSIFDEEQNEVIDDFTLYQNYPNPFNSRTTIIFKVNKTSEITIDVFDLLGNTIKQLINQQTYYPGIYNIKWDGTDESLGVVSSGIYFYQLDNKERKIFKKMILLK
ncbi:MAG TPA: T9SS type A sorting domain-containing protein [Ignavibacteriaceae bacterium]|nr:T9SS type A sorting domain-containing protein [Ignavibacteriaceae bacterium]HRP94209.1 T9SS type A sorting domain-containing protein [Ignavibacteriaceae bacterium]HRQ53739.1 T9SS type A sorting domain-containing protein [Ignavibacteriaceae bacterium]